MESLGESERYAAALAALGMSPGRLRRIMAGREPRQAWEALSEGEHPLDPTRRLRGSIRPALVEAVAERCCKYGLQVFVLDSSGYPTSLVDDPEAPAVLFAQGSAAAVDRVPRVSVVGTRSATSTGRMLAAEISAQLTRAGVTVVSGLALGIDMAALEGADQGRPGSAVAVLGTAHDAVATPQQRAACARVAQGGAVLSEVAPGTPVAPWRFAVRNRIMAALADVVVVVESHPSGGAFHTVAAARRRGVTVAAVPGSVRSPASRGTNALLSEGVRCVRNADDVLDILRDLPGVAFRSPADQAGPGDRAPGLSKRSKAQAPLHGACRRVHDALDHDPATLEALVLRSGLPIGEVALALESLLDGGTVRAERGFWVLS